MTLREAIAKFDTVGRKQFYDHEVRASLSEVSSDEQLTDQFKFEVLAFSFVGNGLENDWGTYYGPQFTGKNDDGTPAYYPSIESVTNDAVLYWESRIPETNNPLFKMRYAGLVWDFKKKVCSDKYPTTLYGDYVQSMIDVINGDYEPHDVITVNVIERLSIFIKRDETYKESIKQALLRFDNERATEDSAARFWGAYINFITGHKGWFSQEEEDACIQKHEQRLNRLFSGEKDNPWAVREQSIVLADYYKSRGKINDVQRVLLLMEKAFRQNKDSMESFQWMGNLEQVSQTYSKYGLNEERKRLFKEIEIAGNEAMKNMPVQSMPFEIPSEAFEWVKTFLTSGEIDEQFEKFCMYFIPKKEEQKKELQRLANQYPLVYLMQTHLMDRHGRPSSIIGSIEKDFDGQLVLHICKTMQLNSIFLHYGIKELISTGALSTDNLMKRVINTPIIDTNRQEIIRQALLAYNADNYITMCHLMIPQIEDAFRSLIDKSGKAVIRPQKDQNNSGFTQRILDDILKDSVITEVFGDDFAFYSRILLTDQRGLNIRNNLCHGLVEPAFFNSVIADRLLHLFCVLTLVRYSE